MIQVRNSEGKSLGYLKNWAGVSPMSVIYAPALHFSSLIFFSYAVPCSNGVNFGSEQEDLHVSFTLPPGTNGPFDILVTVRSPEIKL